MDIYHGTQPPPPTTVELDRAVIERRAQARAVQRGKSLASLRRAADLAIIIGWIVALGSVVAGIGWAITDEDRGFSDNVYPNVGYGIAVGVGGILVGAVVSLFGYWALAWIVETSE